MPEQVRDAPHHFAGGFVGERQQKNAIGRNPLLQQISDPIRERACLARACARDHQCRPGRRGDGGELLLVEFARVINLKMNFRVERLQDVIARHVPKLKLQIPSSKLQKNPTLNFPATALLGTYCWQAVKRVLDM